MIVVLIGYMASGKSSIGRRLADKLDFDFKDLDDQIEKEEALSINDIFELKGEIYFRKKETEQLEKILNSSSKLVLALGGGTPCYGTNMALIQNHASTESIYLKASISTIIKRLENEANKRPLIAHLKTNEALSEFIGKHLFERNAFYDRANVTIKTDTLTENEIVEKILLELFQ